MSDQVSPGNRKSPEVMSYRRHALVEAEMVASLAWLIKLRWFAGIGVILATALIQVFPDLTVPRLPLYAIGAWVLAYNLVFYLVEGRILRASALAESYARLAKIQASLDWVAMTLVIHFSGGVESPAVLFFIFHILIASIFFPPRTAYAFAILACGLVAGTAVLEYYRVISHYPIGIFQEMPLFRNNLYMAAQLGFFTSTALITVYLSSSIQERLRKREDEIVELSEQLQEATKRLEALNETARAVGSTLELPQVLDRLVKNATEAMGVRACSIRLLNEAGKLEPAAVFGLSQEYLNKGPVELTSNPLAREVLSGKVINIGDVPNSPLLQYPEEARSEGIQSMLSAPLMGKSGPLGILRAYAREPQRFTHEDEDFLASIAAQGSIAIENAMVYKSLADLDLTKSQFVRLITHELRSPVSVTRSLLRTILDGYIGDVASQQRDILQRANRRLDFLQKLIDDLLDLAAGKVGILSDEKLEAVDLAAAIERVVRRFKVPAEEKGLALEWLNKSNVKTMVKATHEGIDRIINNLVSNAVRYTPKGGQVAVTLSRLGQEAVITVEDSGIGISEEAMPHLFEEFYRAPNAKEMEHEGTGLGLTISKDIVTRLGGNIAVESKLDEGTTFTVTLPTCQP